jgi:hypothetical protein
MPIQPQKKKRSTASTILVACGDDVDVLSAYDSTTAPSSTSREVLR